MKKLISALLLMTLCIMLVPPQNVSAAVKISKAKATMEVDSTLKLTISGTTSKVSWSSSKKTVATVSTSGTVTAKAEGKTTITASVSGKKYTCSVTVVDSNKVVKEKTLSDLVEYLKSNAVLSGNETQMDASMIGAENGVKYSDSKIELYEYDINSDSYKTIVKTEKITLEGFGIEIPVSAISGKFIILCEDAKNKDTIVKIFNEFK
ncbi:MAG: hypothetical protein K0S76_1028 [Herbinix sp.]|jgi:hypothetical protein|nr:hypothetical protein [Herbinix sp.]